MAEGEGKIEKREITSELKESYLDYAMSVIVGRALPDVRDGLKPVHRRILWAMWEDGLTHDAKFRKSATVVGSCLGRYHPHGDTAVYDALARMAQDFSLRYPLIFGQGNWGCFTKDTKVKLADGRDLSFEELVKEYKGGKRNWTFTFNPKTQKIEIVEIKNPRITRKEEKIIKVSLDNGREIKCTLNHLFMLRNGNYKKTIDLNPGDSLMPAYFNTKRIRSHYNYLAVLQPFTNHYEFVHKLADEYNMRNKKARKIRGSYILHHVDFNKFNNSPDNIVWLTAQQHYKIHLEQVKNLWREKGDEFREKHRESLRKAFSDPAIRKEISKRSKKLWENPIYRAKYPENHFSKMARKLWGSPQIREFHRQKAILQWQTPEFREKALANLTAIRKKRMEEHPYCMKELAQKARVSLKKKWRDPSYKETVIKSKILGYAYYLLKKYPKITPEIYEKERYNNCFPKFGNALEYFNSFSEIIDLSKKYNHKVIKTKILRKREDVYDLTTEPWHNFLLDAGVFVHNSQDGDAPAAMRYTEARLSKIAEELLADIEKETVDFMPNYDASRTEPKVLPAKIPNLLINGADGIAVGMATKIPPHNLSEVIDATIYLIEHTDTSSLELMKFIQGPDFPTGGIIYNKKEIAEAYTTGRGKITVRAVAEVDEKKIIITEIPYQVNKAELIIKIAELVQGKKIEGIRDLRDESDKDGLRIMIELKSGAIPQKVLNQLWNWTDLQKDFHLNMLALEGGLKPKLMSVKDVLLSFIAHREEVVRRRAEFDLKKARERAHILEGLVMALSQIDKIIATIKKSADKEEAHKKLVQNFKLSDIQATAILEMKLQTLAALERKKIEDELKEKQKLIKELTILLKSPQKILDVIKSELNELKSKFGDERKTKIHITGLKEFNVEDLIPAEDTIVTMSGDGYIKRLPPATFKKQRRGGKGLIGAEVGEEDVLQHFFRANTHDNILFFTASGKVYQTKVYEIPAGSRVSKGKAIHNFLEIPPQEKISAVISYAEQRGQQGELTRQSAYLIIATEKGIIKKTELSEFESVRKSGIIAINLKKGDHLKWVKLSSGKDELILTTTLGQAIRFREKEVRPMGRTASGVKAISLKKDDLVSAFDVIDPGKAGEYKMLAVMANGFAKMTPLKQYKVQSRGGKGILTAKITGKTGPLVSAHVIEQGKELLAISVKGQILRTELKSVRSTGRSAQGVRIMRLKPGDKIAGTVCL